MDLALDPLARLARLAAELTQTPMALVSLLTADVQHFVGADGLPEALRVGREAPAANSLCRLVVEE